MSEEPEKPVERIVYVERDRDRMPRWVFRLIVMVLVLGGFGFAIYRADQDAQSKAEDNVCELLNQPLMRPDYCDE